MPPLSQRLQRVPPSATIAMMMRGREMRARGIEVLSLSIGEPDFATPPHAIEAAHQAALRGETRYPPVDGTAVLKAAVQRKFARENKLDYALDEIAVANGGKQIIYNAFMATIDDGDEVVIPAPFFSAYALIAQLCGGRAVTVPCLQENGFRLRPDDLAAAITPRTRWLVLNYPNNPTGAAASHDDIAAIAQVMLRHPDVWIMSDDIYEHLIYDGFAHATIAAVEPTLRDRVLTLNGVSKTYAMTGWRIGYCGAPRPLVRAIANMQGQSTSGASGISQAAAAAALDGPQDLVASQAAIYHSRRNLVLDILAEAPGMTCHRPEGAFYVYPNIAGCLGTVSPGGRRIDTDEDFALALLEERQVSVVQGAAFGMSPYIRLSYATSEAVLREACGGIVQFCADLRATRPIASV
jgi:aspartate aminotransferase